MEFGFFDGGEDGEYNDVGFVDTVCTLFSTEDTCFFGTDPTDWVYKLNVNIIYWCIFLLYWCPFFRIHVCKYYMYQTVMKYHINIFSLWFLIQIITCEIQYLHFLDTVLWPSVEFLSPVTSIFMLPVLIRRSFSACGFMRCFKWLGVPPLNCIRCDGEPVHSSTDVSNECLAWKIKCWLWNMWVVIDIPWNIMSIMDVVNRQ